MTRAVADRSGWTLRLCAWLLATLRGARLVDGQPLRSARGPMIVVSNHASRSDSFFFVHAATRRLAICGARPAWFSSPLRRWLMRWLGVRRVDGRAPFLDDCEALLAEGRLLLLYPEMKTNRDGMGAFSTWAAELALRSGAPVLPCCIHGTGRNQTGRVHLVVGEARSYGPPQTPGSLTEALRAEIVALRARVAP